MKKRRQASSQKAKPPRVVNKSPPVGQSTKAQEPPLKPIHQQPSWTVRNRLRIEVLALVCVVALGLWVRLEDLIPWNKEPGKAFYNGQPLLTGLDGNFYITLARDLVEGTYNPIDEKRSVPDYPPRPNPPPLISFLAATVARVIPVSLNWIAAILPAVLGILIFLPLYGLGRFFGGPLTGTIAALMGLLSPYYVYRSGLGWFDTDILNVTFAAAAAYFFLKFGVTSGIRRYYHFLGGMITYALYLWWWDQTSEAVTVISLAPLAVAIVFFYRPKGREPWLFFGSLFLGLLILVLWKGTAPFSHLLNLVEAQFSYISKETAGAFPNIGISISEQVKPSFDTVVTISSGNFLTFAAALCGFVMLVWRHWKESLFLGVLFGLSVLTFVYARRFAIFCVPIVALGVGSLVHEIWDLRTRFKPLTYATPVIVVLLVWPMLEINHAQTYWPKEQPPIVSGLDLAGKKTPPDAVIWAWWDHGYTIPYWARRASVNDGSVHSGARTVCTGLPLAIDNERLAANFMHFFVARGLHGLESVYAAVGNDQAKGFALVKRILAAGPQQAGTILAEAQLHSTAGHTTTEEWLEFFFPSNPRPVYLLIDELLTRTSYWWFWFGSWDMEKHDGTHVDYRIIPDLYEENGLLKSRRGGFEIDTRTGVVNAGNQTIPLQEFSVWEGESSRSKRFNHPNGLVFEVSAPNHLGVLMHKEIAQSVFNKLYLRQTFSREYFRPVMLNNPWYQLWEVRGDSLKAPSHPGKNGTAAG